MQHSMLWYCVIRKLTVYCICALFLWQCYLSHSYRWTYFNPCHLSFYCKKFSKTRNMAVMTVNVLLTFSSFSNMQITLTLYNAYSYKSFWPDRFLILYLLHAILIILSNNLQLFYYTVFFYLSYSFINIILMLLIYLLIYFYNIITFYLYL